MATDNETVAEIVKEMSGEIEWKRGKMLLSNIATEFAGRIIAAHERELSAEQKRCGEILRDQIAEVERAAEKVSSKDAEIKRLRAALKPVLECELHIGDSLTEAVGEIGTSLKYGVCDEEGSDLWDEDIADNLNAVREAQRIFKQQ